MTREAQFLSWLHANRLTLTSLLPNLPSDLFTPGGVVIVQKILNEEPVRIDAEPFHDAEAADYLQEQLISLVGRETGRAQQSKDIDRILWASHLLEDYQASMKASPVVEYGMVTPQLREVVRTGIQPLDDQIRGLGYGELGIIAAPPGRGKTAALSNFTVTALTDGLDVLYISVADQGLDELVPRIDTCILNTPCPKEPSQEILRQRHHEAKKLIEGKLWIADYTDKECSVNDIAHVIRDVDSGLIIVDHADDVSSPYSNDPTVTRHSLRVVYGMLKKLAVKHHVGIWTASQTHEMSWNMPAGGIGELAEAKTGKATGASIVLVFTGGRKEAHGVMYCSIAKARRNFTQRTFMLSVDMEVNRIW